MAVWPHFTVPSSGSISPARILKRAVWAFSLSPHKGDLVPVAHDKGHLIQHLHAVNGLGHVGDKEDVLTHLTVGGEGHPGVAAGGGGHLFHGELIQQLAAGGSLLGLGLVGGEAGDKVLQLLDLLFVALVLVLMSCCTSWEDSYQKS